MKIYTIKFVVRNTFSSSNFRKRDTRSEKEKERVRAWGKMKKGREEDEDERKCNTGKCNTSYVTCLTSVPSVSLIYDYYYLCRSR